MPRNRETMDIALADEKNPFRTGLILRVPGKDLAAKGFSEARQERLALRYSGPYVDVTASRDTEYLVDKGRAGSLAEAMESLTHPNKNGEMRLPDMSRTLALAPLADLASSREVFSEAREEDTSPKLPDSALSVTDDWER